MFIVPPNSDASHKMSNDSNFTTLLEILYSIEMHIKISMTCELFLNNYSEINGV